MQYSTRLYSVLLYYIMLCYSVLYSVRLAAGAARDDKTIRPSRPQPAPPPNQAAWQRGAPPVWAVLEWLALLTKLSTDDLVATYALVDMGKRPPREVPLLLL